MAAGRPRNSYNDLTGKIYGRLVVKSRVKDKWLCECECGNHTLQETYNLTHGRAVSCGCYRKERPKSQAEMQPIYMEQRKSENKQYQSCMFAASKILSCKILRKAYCQWELCNWYKPQEELDGCK